MIRYTNECVGCPREMGCIGDACRFRRVPHFFCDICGDEIYTAAEVYITPDGDHACATCLLGGTPTLEEEGWDDEDAE